MDHRKLLRVLAVGIIVFLWCDTARAQCPSPDFSGPDVKVTASSDNSQLFPVVTVDPNDRPAGFAMIYLVWEDHEDGLTLLADIKFSSSSDDGATWSPEKTINSNTTWLQMTPSIAVDPDCSTTDGTLWALWVDQAYPYALDREVVVASISTDRGATWTPEVMVEDPLVGPDVGTEARPPDVAVRGPEAWVVWADNRNNRFTLNYDVFLSCGEVSGGAPAFAGPPVVLNDPPPGSRKLLDSDVDVPLYGPFVSPPGYGAAVYATWSDQDMGPRNVLFSSSTVYCTDPVPPETSLPQAGSYVRFGSVIESAFGFVYAAYSDSSWTGTSHTITAQTSTDSGQTWAAEVRVDPTAGGSDFQWYPAMAVTVPWQDGGPLPCEEVWVWHPRLYVAWRQHPAVDRTVGNYWAVCSGDGGATWSGPPSPINDVDGTVRETRRPMALGADIFSNQVYAAWSDSRPPGSPDLSQIWVGVGQ